ncbi:ZBED1 protein, partial [Polyodon spathula]|nr:ZBED1 protein [Polyodon spathula]
MRPISIVEGDGFREFCSEMESRYHIPSHTTISRNILKLYDNTHANVTNTAKELRGSHTAENVAECISEILDDFNIRKSVIDVTTDNALSFVNAVERYLNLINIPCVAHTINLVVQKGLNTGPLNRLKHSAAHFNRSPTDKYLLEDKQKLLVLKNDNLINDCVTHYNSIYNIICQASEQQAAVATVIFEKKLLHLELTTNEWMVVENICDTLKPFKIKEMKNKIYSDLSLRYDKEEHQSTFMLLNDGGDMVCYVKETPLSADNNPLESGLKYPHLAQLAKKYLCVPGTSVLSERVFSTAGNIVNKKRAALDPEQVDRLLFFFL